MSGPISRRWIAALARALWLGSLAGLALLPAAPARAARLVAVRVAQHPGFARVVFESDAPVAFDVEPPSGDEPVRVRLDASCSARSVTARDAPGLQVIVEPSAEGECLAQVRAPGPLRIEAQVLDRPPRVVLDLAPDHEAQTAPPEPVVQEPKAEPPETPSLPTEPPTGAAPPTPAAPESPAAPTAPATPTPPIVAAPTEPEPVSSPPPPPPAPTASSPTEPAASPPREPASSSRVGWDARSLVLGLALGALVGMLASAVGRPQRASRAEPVAAPETEPRTEAQAPVAAPAPASAERPPAETRRPEPGEGEVLSDLLAMLQGIDRRLARVESGCEATLQLCERLTARESAHGEELASQRVALARIDRALRPRPRPPESALGSPR